MVVDQKGSDNEKWYYILAKDDNSQGYFPGETKEAACKKFGINIEHCSAEEVMWAEEGFVCPGEYTQQRLF